MPRIKGMRSGPFRIDTGLWSEGDVTVGLGAQVFSRADVLLPVEIIELLSDEEIVELVREAAPLAVQVADELDEYHRRLYEEEQEKRKESPAPNPREPIEGFVYLVHDGAGAHKIGCTTDLDRRVWDQIQPVYPRSLELVTYWRTGDMEALEGNLHEQYSDSRMNGEWFALTDEQVELLKESGVNGL